MLARITVARAYMEDSTEAISNRVNCNANRKNMLALASSIPANSAIGELPNEGNESLRDNNISNATARPADLAITSGINTAPCST